MPCLVDTTVMVDIGRRHLPTWRWFTAHDAGDLYISTITIGELYRGTYQRHMRDPAKLAVELSRLAVETLSPFEGRELDFDRLAAELWGRMMGEGAARGQKPRTDDAKIAAVAMCHGLTVATSNLRDLAHLCPVIDPRAL